MSRAETAVRRPGVNGRAADGEQLWQNILSRLELQLAPAIFKAWVKDTWLVAYESHRLVVGAGSSYGREWLEKRLYTTVERVVAEEVGRPVEIEIVVGEAAGEAGLGLAGLLEPGDFIRFRERGAGLAVDIRQVNRAGYQPLPDYYARFVSSYLHGKWGKAGLLAYNLWEQEVAVDRQPVKTRAFCNWTKVRSVTLTELAGRLGVSVHSLTGKYIYCWKARQAQQVGEPLGGCCGLRPEGERDFQAGRCRYWQAGILEILSAEGVLAVEELGRLKHYRLELQFWRSWPILTPHQVEKYFTPVKQAEHRAWLERYGGRLGLAVGQWAGEVAQETAEVIEQYPDREAGRVCRQAFRRNPFG